MPLSNKETKVTRESKAGAEADRGGAEEEEVQRCAYSRGVDVCGSCALTPETKVKGPLTLPTPLRQSMRRLMRDIRRPTATRPVSLSIQCIELRKRLIPYASQVLLPLGCLYCTSQTHDTTQTPFAMPKRPLHIHLSDTPAFSRPHAAVLPTNTMGPATALFLKP